MQREENFKHGTTVTFGKKRYVENLRKIEAAETIKRSGFSIVKRFETVPKSSKKNPTHPDKNAILAKKEQLKIRR